MEAILVYYWGIPTPVVFFVQHCGLEGKPLCISELICGHYRTLLISPEDFGDSMLTGNNMEASPLQCNSQLTDMIKENCYVLVCGRCN